MSRHHREPERLKPAQCKTGLFISKSENQNKAAYQCKPASTKAVLFQRHRRLVSNPFFSSHSFESDLDQKLANLEILKTDEEQKQHECPTTQCGSESGTWGVAESKIRDAVGNCHLHIASTSRRSRSTSKQCLCSTAPCLRAQHTQTPHKNLKNFLIGPRSALLLLPMAPMN